MVKGRKSSLLILRSGSFFSGCFSVFYRQRDVVACLPEVWVYAAYYIGASCRDNKCQSVVG